MIDRSKWCYVCGLVSAWHERLMSREALMSLLQLPSPQERLERLRSSLLLADAAPGEVSAERVWDLFEEKVRAIVAVSPDPSIGDLFLLGREWEEFRKFMKSVLLKAGDQRTPPPPDKSADHEPTAREKRLQAYWSGELTDRLSADFADAADMVAAELPLNCQQAAWMDRALDPCELAALVRAAARLESDPLHEWVGTWVRLRAALALLRARLNEWDVSEYWGHFRARGFEDEDLAEVAVGKSAENWPRAMRAMGLAKAEALKMDDPQAPRKLARQIDEKVTELASAAKGEGFGPERVFAFLWALRCEAANQRIVLAAAAHGIPDEHVDAELRKGYA